jgi:probable addiction module antidote protein
MAPKTTPFDPAGYLKKPAAVEDYLRPTFETDDPAKIADTQVAVPRAKRMTAMANETGLTRPAPR